MTTTRKVIFALMFAGATALMIVGLGAGYGRKTPEPGDDQFVQVPAKAAQDTPPAKESSPNPAPKQEVKEPALKEPAKEPAKPKILNMAEAVTVAEKFGKGYTLKAERIERPTLAYTFEIMGIDGVKRQIDLTAEGQLRTAPTKTGASKNKKRPGQ